jgi:acetolactate synthase-1/2/3 large subunit
MIALGARFDDRVTGDPRGFAPDSVKAHVDIDPSEIGKNVAADIAVVGDVKHVLRDLSPMVRNPEWEDWVQTVQQWRDENPMTVGRSGENEILPQTVIERIPRFAPRDVIFVTDVGQNQMWAALHCPIEKPRSFISSGGLGTMGFGLPAAMGAALARPDRQIVNISGDGGIQMNIQELTTCALNRIPVKIVVLNNHFLGMVRQWQELFWDKRYTKTCLKQGAGCPEVCPGPGSECSKIYLPDLVRMSEACGVPALRAADIKELDTVLEEGLTREGPCLMEFMVKPMENVFPMVPPGRPISEILKGDST